MMVRLPKNHLIVLLLINLGSHVISDAYDHRYSNGDTIPIYANRIGPSSKPWERYDYYDLPFCSPDGVKEKKFNQSETLIEESLVPTPYKVEFLVDKECELLCNKRLNKTEVSLFQSAVETDYYMHMYCDDVKFQGFLGKIESDHRDERIKTKYFIYNHFKFYIFYNKDRVIEVLMQGVPNSVIDMIEGKEVDVDFTYSVKWMATKKPFNERMQRFISSSYLDYMPDLTKDNTKFDSIHGYSIANSSFTIFLLIIGILIFYKRVIHKDISRYRCDVEEAEMADLIEDAGWKNIHGDVFRFPQHKSLFAAALGCGSQLLLLMAIILLLGTIGAFQTYLQGVFLNSIAFMYAVTSLVSGYTSVSFYQQMEGANSMKNLLLTGGLYFVPLFLTFTFNNTVAIFTGSKTPLSFGATIMLSLLWILLALPLLLLGAFIGKNKKHDFQAPCKTAKCPREVPQLRWHKHIFPQMVFAGFTPFSVIIIQLHDILYTISGHGNYIFYNSMTIVFFLLLITTILVSIMMTYFQLASEDHEWWWRSFFIGGSTGLYVYGYSIYYYFCLSDMNGFMQTTSFFGYMGCISYGIFLLLGTVGFHASLFFVRYLYASIKCD